MFLKILNKYKSKQTDQTVLFDAFMHAIPMEYCGWNDSDVQVISPKLEELLSHAPIRSFDDFQNVFIKKDAQRLGVAFNELKKEHKAFQMTLYSKNCLKVFKVLGTMGSSFEGLQNFYVLWFCDVTEEENKTIHQQEKLEKIKNTEDLCQSIFQSIHLPIWMRDENLNLIWCNKAYADLFNDSIKNVLEKRQELLPQDFARELAEKVHTSGKISTIKEHIVLQGQRRYVQIYERPFVGKGRQFGVMEDLTETETMQMEMKRLAVANKQVLEQINIAVAIFNPDMTLEFFNSAYNNLWNLPENWLYTKPSLPNILDRMRQNRKLPERVDFKNYIDEWKEYFHSVIDSYEEMLYLPDGKALRMLIVPHPDGGIMVSYEDVTSRLELESSYNTLIAVQRETIDHLAEAISVFGADGRLKLYNKSYKTIWNLEDDQLSTMPHITELVDLVPRFFEKENWKETRQKMINSCLRRESDAGQFERQDGTIIEYTLVPLPDGGLLCSYVDVTDTVKVETALREKNAALEEAEKLKSGFLANVSYQLRTPLNAMMGFADILNQEYFGKLNEKQKEYTSGMLEAGTRLVKLIDDILDLASIEAGYLNLDVQEVKIYKVIQDIESLTTDWVDAKSLRIIFECPKNIGSLNVDERRLKQVLINLIQNAIHFTNQSGEIHLKVKKQQAGISFLVSDNGIGIEQEELERIFTPFRRSRSQTKQGAGIGLSLVKSIIELHGGTLSIQSEKGQGTEVTCFFPFESKH